MVHETRLPGFSGRPSRRFSQAQAETAKLGLTIYALALLLGERLNMPEMLEIAGQVKESQQDLWAAVRDAQVVTPGVSPAVDLPRPAAETAADEPPRRSKMMCEIDKALAGIKWPEPPRDPPPMTEEEIEAMLKSPAFRCISLAGG